MDLVSVDVLVTDGGRVVTGLGVEDFEVRDNGVVQRIRSVTTGEVPVSMLLVLDSSASVDGPALERLKDASRTALDVLRADDRSALLTFSSALILRADWGQPNGTRAALAEIRAGGATSLYDAAFAALVYSDPSPGRRSLVVLFSDGEDTSSWLPAHVVRDAAERTESVVYSVTLRPPRPELRLEYRSGIQLGPIAPPPSGGVHPLIAEVADLTGGTLTTTPDPAELRETFTSIVKDFRSRYIISYMPEGVGAPGWHPIEVRLTKSSGLVTARRGYLR